MAKDVSMHIIAHVRSGFSEKFGIPRQSGLVDSIRAIIEFEEEYRDASAFRGLEDYSHIWLIWQFSKAQRSTWSPTVRPPRLGGNRRMGVFATRSPFRPNAIGLSCVKLERVEYHAEKGPILHILGADLLDGTPIFDIKPYLPYTDAHPDAKSGFSKSFEQVDMALEFPEELLAKVPEEHREAILALLRQDPRPAYQDEPDRRYGMTYAGYDIRFFVADDVLRVVDVVKV